MSGQVKVDVGSNARELQAFSLNPMPLWTGSSHNSAILDEKNLISRYVHSPYKLGRVAVDLPTLGLGTQYMNTLDVHPDVTTGVPILWLHGAGAGLGLGYRNFDALANLNGRKQRVIGVDWLGQAGSSRPSFPYGGFRAPAWSLAESKQVDAAIAFSVDSLEALRAALNLEQFDLVAHSMGGYLATQYALTHPARVRRLVLVSPVGWAAKPEGELARGRAGGLFGCLWDAGVGNFGFLRALGRLARGTAKSAVVGRFRIQDEEERALVADYFWSQLTAQP